MPISPQGIIHCELVPVTAFAPPATTLTSVWIFPMGRIPDTDAREVTDPPGSSVPIEMLRVTAVPRESVIFRCATGESTVLPVLTTRTEAVALALAPKSAPVELCTLRTGDATASLEISGP